ncbi:MAG: protein kinase [Acidobacteriaceae bacterium]
MEKHVTLAEQLFGEALELPRAERAAFLDSACRGLPEVRRAVEDLLAENERLSGLLSTTPYAKQDDGAGAGAESANAVGFLVAGTRLGRYTILGPLGSGGMGVVYRARDEKLERVVAIKLLVHGALTGEEGRRHFRREALALAKLNHPHIAAVYDAEEQDGTHFIVMELVEGESLAARLRGGALSGKEATAIALQVAEALGEAHEHGVIHRDLKPANVMVTSKGVAKVLDFGVAKVLGLGADSARSSAETGGPLGTPQYMSPEQALGRSLDARTDLWSLGVLYYECLTGRPPFRGKSSLAILQAVTAEPLPGVGPEVPALAEQIVMRALEKDPDLRYQHASEIATDLRRVMRDLEPQSAGIPGSASAAVRVKPPWPTRRRRAFSVLGLALTAAVLVAVAGWIRGHSFSTRAAKRPSPLASTAFSRMRIAPLTNLPGAVWSPAFSPDAKQIAFIWDGENPGRGDVYVQLVGGDMPLRLTHTRTGFVDTPAWSPDGQEIAFGRCDDRGGAVYVVPALGGPERRLTEVACPNGESGSPNWTSDGRSLVLSDRCTPGGATGIAVFSMETGLKRCLTAPPLGEGQGDLHPALSPDQQTIAFVRFSTAEVSDIYTVPLAGGPARRLTSGNKAAWYLMWAPDGRTISFDSYRAGIGRIWRVSVAAGAIQPETIYPAIGALSRDGARLAYIEPSDFWRSSSVIWRADLSAADKKVLGMRKLLQSSPGDYGPQASPDGSQIAFESARSGRMEIWKCNADGSDPLRLTSLDGHAGTPRWSPDGRWIAFDYRPAGQSQIFVIDKDGRNLHSVTGGDYESVVPSWSGDGKSIYFASNRTGAFQTWRHELASGRETQVTHHGGFAGFESHDGATLYFSKFNAGGVWSVPVAGGEEKRITDAPHLGYWGSFAVTKDGLYMIDSEAERGPALLYYAFRTQRLSRILGLNQDQSAPPWAANLGASADGRIVLFAQGTSRSSIVLAENLQ